MRSIPQDHSSLFNSQKDFEGILEKSSTFHTNNELNRSSSHSVRSEPVPFKFISAFELIRIRVEEKQQQNKVMPIIESPVELSSSSSYSSIEESSPIRETPEKIIPPKIPR